MSKKGFTLFELLVSISIIGILTALISFSFSAAQRKARDSRRMQDMKAVQSAAEQYYGLNSYSYPLSTTTPWVVNSQTVLEIYPTDPKSGSYVSSFSATAYCVCALLENTTSGNASNSTCTFAAGGSYFCVKNQQ